MLLGIHLFCCFLKATGIQKGVSSLFYLLFSLAVNTQVAIVFFFCTQSFSKIYALKWDCWVINLTKYSQLVSKRATCIKNLSEVYKYLHFLISLPAYKIARLPKIFINLTGVKWYLVVLVCMALIMDEFEHVSIYSSFGFPLLWTGCLYPLANFLLVFLPIFSLICRDFFFILVISIQFCKYILSTCHLLFWLWCPWMGRNTKKCWYNQINQFPTNGWWYFGSYFKGSSSCGRHFRLF